MQQILKSVSIALQNIKANPLHTFLSTLGIIIGVAALVGILSLGDGLEQSARSQIAGTTSVQMMSVTSQQLKTINKVRVPRDTVYQLNKSHVAELENKFNGRAIIELINQTTGTAAYGDSTLGVYLQGSLYNIPNFRSEDDSLHGRFYSREEVESAEKVTVLSESLISGWGISTEEILEKNISLNKQIFKVIGIFSSSQDISRAFIPITALGNLKKETLYPNIIMRANLVEDIPRLKEETEQWLDAAFEEGKDAFYVSTNEMRVEQIRKGIFVFKLVMGAITGISVLVGGIGVMNVLLISVTERTKEIGIRKAAGAKKKDIVLQFLSESVTISLVGCFIGALTGFFGTLGIVAIINYVTDFGFEAAMTLDTAGMILAVALFVGMVFGTYPAWRAAQLTPVDAIRHE